PALLLHFGDRMQREGRLAGGFRTVDLHDAAAGVTADAQRDVEAQRSRRNRGHVLREGLLVAETHDRTLAELLFDRLDRQLDRLAFLSGRSLIAALLFNHIHLEILPERHPGDPSPKRRLPLLTAGSVPSSVRICFERTTRSMKEKRGRWR